MDEKLENIKIASCSPIPGGQKVEYRFKEDIVEMRIGSHIGFYWLNISKEVAMELATSTIQHFQERESRHGYNIIARGINLPEEVYAMLTPQGDVCYTGTLEECKYQIEVINNQLDSNQ